MAKLQTIVARDSLRLTCQAKLVQHWIHESARAVTGKWPIAVLSILLGVSLAPFFPATFALLIANGPSARQAGIVLAMSGLGAASLPPLMGVVSTHSGSLRTALVIPLAAAISLLALSFFSSQHATSNSNPANASS